MDAYRVAFNTWQEKTEWVQKDKRFDILLPWGKHRADVLKEYIDHLEAKFAALAAENAGLKAFGSKLDGMHNDLNGEGTGIQGRAEVACQQAAIEAAMEEFDAIKTPSTDASLAEVRAQGVEMFADFWEGNCRHNDTFIGGEAKKFAAQLRQDANTAELVAAGIITRIEE